MNHQLREGAGWGGLHCLPPGCDAQTGRASSYLQSHEHSQARAGMLTSWLGNVTAHPPPCSVEPPHSPQWGAAALPAAPAGPTAAGHLCQNSPKPPPQAPHSPPRRTGAGVVHVPVVDQHFVKEDNTPVAGERLLGEPHGERHQEGRWNPWNREDGCSQAGGGGLEDEARVPVSGGSLPALLCLQSIEQRPGTCPLRAR